MIYANEGGGNERYNLTFGPIRTQRYAVHAPFPNLFHFDL